MFISTEDFKVVASEASLKVITQADPDNVENAIAEAIEEVVGTCAHDTTAARYSPPRATTETASW